MPRQDSEVSTSYSIFNTQAWACLQKGDGVYGKSIVFSEKLTVFC